MSTKFIVYNGSAIIGTSELEMSDAYQGIRAGHFTPEPAYAELEPLYQELLSFDEHNPQLTAEQRQANKQRDDTLRGTAAALPLRLETAAGQIIPTEWIHIDDFTAELGGDERQVTVFVNGPQTIWERG